MKDYLILLCLLVLCSCNPAYKQPETGDTAKVRFIIERSERKVEPLSVYIHPDDQCSKAFKLRELAAFLPQIGGIDKDEVEIGMSKQPGVEYNQGSFVEVKVVSGERVNFSLIGVAYPKQCRISASFMPLNNREYEVLYNNSDQHCSAEISEINVVEGQYIKKPEPSVVQKKNPCWHFYN